MAWRMYPCPNCGRPWVVCGGRCRRRNEDLTHLLENDERKFDVSFQCYTCELHFDKDTGAPKKNEENGHEHTNRSLLFTTQWEEVVYLMCQNLITLMKYRDAIENKATEIIKNETLHDYILTRLENIENCWCSLFLSGKINIEEYKEFSREHETFLNLLNSGSTWGNNEEQFTHWQNVGTFNKYIYWIENSPLFKNNDVKIL